MPQIDIAERTLPLPDGWPVHFLDAGEGPTVVLLHGGGSRASIFAAVIARLATRFRVIAPDLRGFGATQAPPGAPISHDIWRQDLAGLIDALSLSQVAVAGWSLGASVALNYAAQAPERVRALALIGTPHPDRPVNRAYFEERLALLRGADDPAEVIDRFFPNVAAMFGAWAREHRPKALETVRAEQIAAAPCAVAVTLAYETKPDYHALLPLIRCPTTIVVGDEDRIGDAPAAQALAAELTDARIMVIERCGHYHAVEQPEALARALEEAFG